MRRYEDLEDLWKVFPRAERMRELAPGVRLRDVDTWWDMGEERDAFGDPPIPRGTLKYEVHGHSVTMVSGDLFAASPSIGSVTVDGGDVTTALLRALPLADARSRLRTMSMAWTVNNIPWDEVDRLTTDEQWAAFAKAYADLVAKGERSPIVRLAKALELSRNTISARVRLARDRGLLTRPDGSSPGVLTDKARRLLGND